MVPFCEGFLLGGGFEENEKKKREILNPTCSFETQFVREASVPLEISGPLKPDLAKQRDAIQ